MNEYIRGASLPDWGVNWTTADGTTIDYSSGWTFEGRMVNSQTYVEAFTKTSGITGAATSPNVTVQWTVNELDITPGEYVFYLEATQTSTSKKRVSNYDFRIVDPGP